MLQKMKVWVKENQAALLKITAMTVVYVVLPNVGYASKTAMPWSDGLTTIKEWITGPVPTTVGAIALAASCIMLSFGEMGPAAKKALQIVIGVSGALQAGNLITYIGKDASGFLIP